MEPKMDLNQSKIDKKSSPDSIFSSWCFAEAFERYFGALEGNFCAQKRISVTGPTPRKRSIKKPQEI